LGSDEWKHCRNASEPEKTNGGIFGFGHASRLLVSITTFPKGLGYSAKLSNVQRMSAVTINKADIAREAIKRFPNAATNELARVIYKQNPMLFPTYNAARCAVRYARGCQGDKLRKKISSAGKAGLPKTTKAEPMTLPEPKTEWNEAWGAVAIRARKLLNLSDIHLPYHDKTALEVALKTGQDEGVDAILLNGDFMDIFSLSRWEKDPKQRDLAGEITMGREVLEMLREEFKGKQIIWKHGNHEERWEAFLWRKAPELLGVDDFELENVMRCNQNNVRVVKDMRPIRINKLNILHGHEYKFAISNPVNPARGLYMRAKTNACMGHLHQTSEHTEADLNGKIVTCWSQGCLCDLHPRYSPLNKWNHGFQIIDTTGEDDFRVSNFRIDKGRLY
jgi:predicted phosphodiesterase